MVTTVATPGGVLRDFGNVRVPGDAAGGVEVGLAFLHPAGRNYRSSSANWRAGRRA